MATYIARGARKRTALDNGAQPLSAPRLKRGSLVLIAKEEEGERFIAKKYTLPDSKCLRKRVFATISGHKFNREWG